MLCKKSHTEMTVMQEDNVSGLICPKCGWNIVTTKIDDIMLDTQLYQLYILKNEHINRNQIRILSKISGMNYICIKQNIVTRNKTLLISDRAFKIKAIKEMLEKEVPGLNVVLIDERLTTKVAQDQLIFADVSRKKRKQVIDKMAAVAILQGYLDAQ